MYVITITCFYTLPGAAGRRQVMASTWQSGETGGALNRVHVNEYMLIQLYSLRLGVRGSMWWSTYIIYNH